MATRSSAKLLHSKSYAGTHKYKHTQISGRHHYIVFHCAREQHSFEGEASRLKRAACRVPPSPLPSPGATATSRKSFAVRRREWVEEEEQEAARKDGDQVQGERETPLASSSLLTKQQFCYLFIYLLQVLCVRVKWVTNLDMQGA